MPVTLTRLLTFIFPQLVVAEVYIRQRGRASVKELFGNIDSSLWPLTANKKPFVMPFQRWLPLALSLWSDGQVLWKPPVQENKGRKWFTKYSTLHVQCLALSLFNSYIHQTEIKIKYNTLCYYSQDISLIMDI